MSASIKAGLNNDMHLMTDGVTRAYVDGNGKVGIGTDSPDRDLHVNGTVTNSKAFARFTHDGLASTGLDVGYSSGGYASIYNAENTATVFSTNATERMRIDASGHVTTPNQTSFLAGMSGVQSLNNATVTKVNFNQAVEQTGSSYNTSNYRFTCPVAGRYLFTYHVYVYSVKNMEVKLYKNGSSLIRIASPVAYQNENPHGGGGSTVLQANANDYFEIYAAGYRSDTSTSLVYPGSGSERASHFSGMLIG